MSELIDRKAAIRATWQEPSYTDPLNVLTEVRDRINALPTIPAPRWHRVEDEMPPDGKEVWCAIYTTDLIVSKPCETVWEACERVQKEAARHPRCEMGVYYEDEGWSECRFGAPMVCQPKYWCYLPEPPKEDV